MNFEYLIQRFKKDFDFYGRPTSDDWNRGYEASLFEVINWLEKYEDEETCISYNISNVPMCYSCGHILTDYDIEGVHKVPGYRCPNCNREFRK